MIKNECNKNYCKNGASCVYKWFTNECTNCLHPFYGKQCQLEATKLGLLNKSPASPLSAYVTLGLIRSSRSDTFKMSFQITHINNNDSDEPEQFLFLTLKQLDQNEKMEYFYILSIDENGYLNMKKIQFNLVDLSKTLKWSLSNDKFNLSDVNTFKLNVKMSEFFIEACKAIGSVSDINHCPSLNMYSYNKTINAANTETATIMSQTSISNTFIIGCDLEVYSNAEKESIFSGYNSTTDDIFIQLQFGGNLGAAIASLRFDFFALYDSLLVCENNTCYCKF
jgi:hypothetical protein